MSVPSAQAATGGTKTHELRVPKGGDRKIFVSKFSNSLNIDFGTWKKNAPEFVREGAQNDTRGGQVLAEDDTPKVGAGSEFGKDKRDEARRKKYTRRARSNDVPWVMTDAVSNKKYRGTKEGGVQDNSSYYIFTTVGGRIEAYPVSEWFNFTPIQRYKALNEDEAEEAFERRDKVFNYFNIMYQKRLKTTGEEGEDGAEDGGGEGKASGSGGRRGGLKIKDDEDDEKPATMSDSDEDGTAEDTTAVAGPKKGKGKAKKAKPKAPPKNKKKKKTEDNDDFMEPAEESDDGDFETRELDYETSDSEDNMEDVPEQEITPKGIDEETEQMQEEEDEEEEAKKEAEGNKDMSIEDTLANSDSDNDEEDIDAIADSRIPAKRVEPSETGPGTPSDKKNSQGKGSTAKGTKRKQENGSASQQAGNLKKVKTERPTGSEGAASLSGDGKLDEEALVRQYLTRKPITSKELLRKLTKRGVRTENLNNRVGEIIKRLNPEKTMHSGKLMLHLKT